ncbi:VCBS domain-containing protein [Vibrio tapetis]|uniref:Uncharacterized protein n=1 Tax=Vibrio tapetis subsp. tapetis TaxID=1671868 RepID=A0A2N8ZM34_9VIBR|nr:VCBS domain-containing protein [Vibrio tapetis]SON52978.1 protein of unknown function [Vibrio tapetis subsp. tapetis]
MSKNVEKTRSKKHQDKRHSSLSEKRKLRLHKIRQTGPSRLNIPLRSPLMLVLPSFQAATFINEPDSAIHDESSQTPNPNADSQHSESIATSLSEEVKPSSHAALAQQASQVEHPRTQALASEDQHNVSSNNKVQSSHHLATSFPSIGTGSPATNSTTPVSTVAPTTAQPTIHPSTQNSPSILSSNQAHIGGIDSGTVTEDTQLTVSGTLSIIDPDVGEALFASRVVHGNLGVLHLNSKGTWVYDLDSSNPAVQALAKGATATDTITVQSVDGTQHQVTITVNGTNDSAVISGTHSGAVTEETALTTSGQLNITDTDTGEAHFSDINIAGSLGTLHLTDNGAWRYDLDNRNPTVQALAKGATATDTITVQSVDGTQHQVTITVNGTNDAAVISGDVTKTFNENALFDTNKHDLATLQHARTLSGTLTSQDMDHGQTNQFQPIHNQMGHYGSISLDSTGHWQYQLAPSEGQTVDELAQGEHITESFSVHAIDGSSKTITLTLIGDNDNAAILDVGRSHLTITEDNASNIDQLGLLRASGRVDVQDVDDRGQLHQQTFLTDETAKTPLGGIFTVKGYSWDYQIDPNNPKVQALAAGETLIEKHTVTSLDGTATHEISVTIVGTNDSATIGGTSSAHLTEDKVISATGQLTITDIDHNQAHFSDTDIQGAFGVLHLKDTGEWTYQLNNNDQKLQQLSQHQHVNDFINIQSNDGTPHQISILIDGTNDAAVITGTTSATLTEDQIYGMQWLLFNGHMKVSDADMGEAHFDPILHAHNIAGIGYTSSLGARVIVTSDGDWHYQLDNNITQVQTLGQGQSCLDRVTIHTLDGTAQELQITITGTNDTPTVTGSRAIPPGSEDNSIRITQAQLLTGASDIDANDQGLLHVDSVLADNGTVTHNRDGSFTFRPNPDYNGQVKFSYDVLDRHGGVTHADATTTLSASNDSATLEASLSSNTVTEDQLKLGSNTDLWSGWNNLDIKDVDATTEAKVTHIEVNGVQHAVPVNFAMNLAGAHGTFNFTHGTDGHDKWSYTANNTHSEVQGLSHGDSLTDSITLITVDGTRIPLTATINGTDDHVVIDTPNALSSPLGKAIEDVTTSVSGTFNAHDLDNQDTVSFKAGDTIGHYGTLHVDTNGHWHYNLDPHKADSLRAGQIHAEGFDITAVSTDGSQTTQRVQINVQGSNDLAIVSVASTENVTEDGSHSSHNNGRTTELANGQLNVIDPDSGQNKFQYSQFGESAVHDPFAGMLRIDNSGSWGYSVDNANLQRLAQGQVETVVYRVHSYDGTAYELHIDVIGTNDAPAAIKVALTDGIEDTQYQMQASQFGFTDVDSGDQLHSIVLTDLPPANQGKFVFDGHDVVSGQRITTADIIKLQFVPAQDFNGDVSFKYSVSDGRLDSAQATNTLHIAPVGDASVVTGDNSDSIVEGNLSDNVTTSGQLFITDPDAGDNPSFPYLSSTATTYGDIQMVNGKWTYTLDESKVQHLDPDNPSVLDHYTFTASDGHTQTIGITIKGSNDKPIIESAHAAPANTSPALKLQDVNVISDPTGANIDIAPTDAENAQRWGTDKTGASSGIKLVGLYKPGSDHNWVTHPATTSTAHSGPGGYNRVNSHDWWAQNGIPDTINTGSGGASGHGNAWSGGVVVFEDSAGHQTIGIVNRVCTGGGSEVDYLYYHTYENLRIGHAAYSGSGTPGETIHIMDGHTQLASIIVDNNGHWEVAGDHLPDGSHTLHIENGAGQKSSEMVVNVQGTTVDNVTPAGMYAELKEDSGQTTVNGELRTSDIDSGDTAHFVTQTDHGTQYGHFSLDGNGHYHYTLDNTNPVVNALGIHQTLTEVIPVTSTSTDGTQVTRNITITIQGSVDSPVLTATAPDAQQGTLMALTLNVDSADTGGDTEDMLIKISGLPDNAVLNHGTHDARAKLWVLHKSDLNGLELDLKDPSFHGDLHFSVTATASAGGESQSTTQAVSLFVNAPPAVASSVSGTKAEDSGMGAINLLDGATDPDSGDVLSIGNLAYQIGSGSVSTAIPSFLTLARDGHTLIVNSNATQFQHLSDGESETITVTYNVEDSHGGHLAQSATITVTGTNDAAQISGQTNTDGRTHITEDIHVSRSHMVSSDQMNLSIHDLDSGQNYFIPTGKNTSNSNATSYGVWVDGDKHIGEFILHASGEWYFRANTNSPTIDQLAASEKIIDTITVHSADGTTQLLTAVVYGSNDQPSITAQVITATEDADYQFSVADFGFTDKDSSDKLDHITISSLPDVLEGRMLLNGQVISANQDISRGDIANLIFRPTANFHTTGTNTVQFGYTVNDGISDSQQASAQLTVDNVNDVPVVTGPTSAHTTEDITGGLIITESQLLSGASDLDGDALHVNSLSVDPSQGNIIDNHDGTWTFTPGSNFKGTADIHYNLTDGQSTINNIMAIAVDPITDKANAQLSFTTEQQVLQFSANSSGGMTNNGQLQTGGNIDNLAVEFNIIGGPTAPPAGINGPTFVSYGVAGTSQDLFYVWNPTDLTIRIDGHEYKTGISATDGQTHRYSVLWSSSTGHLELLVDGNSKWSHSGPVAQGYHLTGNGILAVGNDQDHYNLETGSHVDHGFSRADAFHGQIFSVSLANVPVTAAQLKSAPLSTVVDKDTGLVIDVRANAAGQFVDTTGHHQITATADVQAHATLVDASVAIPNTDALIHLNPNVTPPQDSDDIVTRITLTGLIKGTILEDKHGHTHTVTGPTEMLDIKDWSMTTLTAQLPGGNKQNMHIGLTVTTQGPDGTTATDSHFQSLILDPTRPVPNAIITGINQVQTDEVTSVIGQLTITDTDSRDAHFVAQVLPSTHGEFTIAENGHWEFTPNRSALALTQGHNATDVVTVKSVDGTEKQLSVTLIGSDTAPTAVLTDFGAAEAGTPRIIQASTLLSTVTDVDTMASSLSVVVGSLHSAHGSFSPNPDGSYQFIPTAGFVGQDVAVDYQVTDGTNRVDVHGIVDINPPLAITHLSHDTGTSSTDFITSDGRLIVHGTAVPGALVSGSSLLHGLTAIADKNGQWALDASNIDRADGHYNLMVYTKHADGTFGIINHLVTIDTAKPTITIAPVAHDDWVDHQEHSQDVLIEGSTTHVADGDIVSVTLAGHHYTTQVQQNHWQLTVPSAEISQIGDNAYSVHAEVSATATGDNAQVQRHIIVSADLSTLIAPEHIAEDTKTSAAGSLFTPNSFNLITSTGLLQGNYGSLQINADGSYHYQLDNTDSGIQTLGASATLTDNFFVTYTNPHGDIKHAVLNIGIHGTNDAPTLTGTFEISRSVTTGSQTKTHSYGYIDINDADQGDTLLVEYIDKGGVAHQLNISDTHNEKINVQGIGYFDIESSGKWNFTLSHSGPERTHMNQEIASGKIHTESVILRVTDSTGASRTETLSVHIGDGKTGPQIFGASESVVTEDKVLSSHGLLDLLVHDVKVATGVTWALKPGSMPLYGDLTFHPDGSWEYTDHNQDPSVQSLAQGERLEESIIVIATDTNGHSVEQTMKLAIIGTNDVPVVGHPISATTGEDSLLTISKADLLANLQDSDSKDSLDVTNLHLIGGGTITPQGDHWVIHPDINFSGNLRLSYSVTDGHVNVDSSMAIHITANADTPTMVFTKHVGDLTSPLDSMDIQGLENTDLALNINVSSPDTSETLTVEVSGLPTGTTLSAGHEHLGIWTIAQADLTNLTLSPPANYSGNFDIQVKAISHDGTDTAEVSQQITAHVNAAPPPPVPTQADEPDPQTIEDLSLMTDNVASRASTDLQPTGASAYLQALGIHSDKLGDENVQPQSAPADMDLVFAQSDETHGAFHTAQDADASDALEHGSQQHDHDHDQQNNPQHDDLNNMNDFDPNN